MTLDESTSRERSDAVAEDAESLAALHDRELTPALLAALREAGFPACLGLLPASTPAVEAWRAMAEALCELPASPDAAIMDELASEYAAIYLTGAFNASPYESVWTNDDHLTCQDSMFQLREIYAAAGLATPDWRQRADDHLVLQLLYIAHAARQATTDDHWRDLAKMLDEHLFRWIREFAVRVTQRCNLPFYPALAVITASWLDTLRDLIASSLNEPRPSREEVEQRFKPPPPQPQPIHFVPGANGPSW